MVAIPYTLMHLTFHTGNLGGSGCSLEIPIQTYPKGKEAADPV